MRKKKFLLISLLAAFFVVFIVPVESYGQADRRTERDVQREAERRERERQEVLRQIERLQRTRAEEEARARAAMDAPVANIEQTLAQFENYYNSSCIGEDARGTTSRCADALYSMAVFYYRDARDGFVRAQSDFDVAMTRWERSRQGARPIPPRPDYSRALATFKEAVRKYPTFGRAAEGWLNIGNIYLLDGDIKNARAAFEELTKRFPNSRLASAAHFRVAEICFSDVNDLSCALDNLLKIRNDDVNPDIREMAHFRKAEIYYRRSDFNEAARLFGDYVDKCDRREFPRRELRSEALQYLADAFSHMSEYGADSAIAYFRRVGNRTYEDTIIYFVGMKNYERAGYDQAIIALRRAIERFPNFVDAPQAHMNIVNSLVIRRRNEEANQEREKLITNFSAGSGWARANARNPIALARAEENVKQALMSVAIYYHALAQQATDPAVKLAHYNKAIEYYERVIAGYPDDKWMVFEYRYNVAEAYMATGQFEKAANSYEFVAAADLRTFPVYRANIDTIGMEAGEAERARSAGAGQTSPVNISQSDAGFNAIVALDTLRKIEIARGNLTPQQAYALPITTRYLNYIRTYQQRFPDSPSAPEVLYWAASVHFDGGNFREAVATCLSLLSAYGRTDTAMFRRATKLAADSYVEDKQFELGIALYDTLINRTPATSPDRQIYIDLGARAIFQKASDLRANRQITAAANEFMRISSKYPASQIAHSGWFEAAVTYEEADSSVAAARIFAELPTRFPKSDLVERAFVRAAEAYAKVGDYMSAGATMRRAGEFVNNPEFSIGAFSKASEYYKLAKEFILAGDMFHEIFRRFPTDKATPQALYNAGLLYEEGGNYTKAIEVYTILGTRYSDSEFAPSGYFSIGLAYEKMGDLPKMAAAFVEYARRFTSNRDAQIKALIKAGQAFNEMGNAAEAENNFRLATQIYSRFAESDALSPEDGAKAFFHLAELLRAKFEAIKLTGRNQRDIDAAVKRKRDAFPPVIEAYMSAAGMAIAEWTIRSIFSIGLAYKNFAADFRDQTLIGNAEQRMGTQVGILSDGIHPIYEEALSNFARAVSLARENGIRADYVREAELYLMQTWFLKGYAFEEAGDILRAAPIPAGMDEEEEMAYIDALEEFYVKYVQAAFPVYEMGISNAVGLFIGKNMWTDTIQAHLQLLAAGFGIEAGEAASIDLNAAVAAARADGRFVEHSAADLARRQAETDNRQAMAAINAIMASGNSVEDKLSTLASRRTNAERAKLEEEAKIAELRKRLGN